MMLDVIHSLVTPDPSPRTSVIAASFIAMAVIFAFDIFTPAEVRLHALYIFPLAAIALHCENKAVLAIGTIVSVTFQLLNFYIQEFPTDSFVTDSIVAFTSSALTIGLARSNRHNYLLALDRANHDFLTGLQSRRSFYAAAELEISRQKRYGGVFSLALIDLDNFKLLNDSLGHKCGDQALVLLAKTLSDHRRESDSIARLGGDEFAILMPNTSELDCSNICVKISEQVAKDMAKSDFPVTASIGVATFKEPPKTLEDALDQADAAMYANKVGKRSG